MGRSCALLLALKGQQTVQQWCGAELWARAWSAVLDEDGRAVVFGRIRTRTEQHADPLHPSQPPLSPPPLFAPSPSTRLSTSLSAGELNPDELERIVTIIQNPTQFKIPNWFLNRQKVRRLLGAAVLRRIEADLACASHRTGSTESTVSFFPTSLTRRCVPSLCLTLGASERAC